MKRLKDIMDGNTDNYIAPFLWLHNEDDELIVRELERIRECGIGAVCLESRTHDEFCRDDWWDDVRLIIDTCKRLDMKLWILDDKHFPSGYANGIFEEKCKHLQPKNIRSRRIDAVGPICSGQVLADQWKMLPAFQMSSVEFSQISQYRMFHPDQTWMHIFGLFQYHVPDHNFHHLPWRNDVPFLQKIRYRNS